MQQAYQAEPAAEPELVQAPAAAAVEQAAQGLQREGHAAVQGLGQAVAPQATHDGPPVPVFGGGQVLRTVLAFQGGSLHGLPGLPQGTPDPIQINVDLEADYEILPAMGE